MIFSYCSIPMSEEIVIEIQGININATNIILRIVRNRYRETSQYYLCYTYTIINVLTL